MAHHEIGRVEGPQDNSSESRASKIVKSFRAIHESRFHKSHFISRRQESKKAGAGVDPKDEYVGTVGGTENKLDVPMIKQERGQCGSASLAMMIQYWHEQDPENPLVTKEQIVSQANPLDGTLPEGKWSIELLGHAVEIEGRGSGYGVRIDGNQKFRLSLAGQTNVGLTNVARENGYSAAIVNNANQEQLKAAVDNGIPVMIAIDINDSGRINHDVVVTGYRTDEKGNITEWIINNPWGQEIRYDPETLDSKWSSEGKISAGINREMMMIVPRGQEHLLPAEEHEGLGGELIATAGNDVIHGIKEHDPGSLAKAGVEVAGGAVSTAFYLSGLIQDKVGDHLNNVGEDLKESGNPVGQFAGDILDKVGDGLNQSGDFLEDVSDLVADATHDIASPVRQGVNAGIEKAADVIEDGCDLAVKTGKNIIQGGKDLLTDISDRLFSFWGEIARG
ncbi:MAG: C39 family peptidase [Candidatus Eremiobacteraeota bacterium]|nr:C39 family peptidase [Candidatus Eremiobacteraeota bacterium]